ncbi:aminoglycoside phosphotransferase family protein [Aureibacillus halotolerans]|uniref:Streptomycin 6-kinase n=1 Tax=Aureibacillus halotolerans TaxID=1508390 RepID=A0A4V3D5T1_9BACI|nr:aminoglycoside phosphotransferase family protein [Aureibacillus halotolerans]TDQ41247.1 streptomycin 6-kinase [Aureibacillus halotolerans]
MKWLAGLESLVSSIEEDWGIIVKEPLAGGSEAYVAKVLLKDGIPAILKVGMPEMDGNTVLTHEVRTLQSANGQGYARLLQYNLDKRALLIEKLGPPLSASGFSTKRKLETICMTLKTAWSNSPFPLAELQEVDSSPADWFSGFIPSMWKKLDQPCSKQVISTTERFVKSRSQDFQPDEVVLAHGDAHEGNLLKDPTEQTNLSYKLIDPDGVVAEKTYDLGVLMRVWPEELLTDPFHLGEERCRLLSTYTGVKPQAIWEWGFLQCVATGLLLGQMGQTKASQQLLSIAEAWAMDA